MIRSFKHRGLKRLYERGDRSGIRPDLLDTVEESCTLLDESPRRKHLIFRVIACIRSKVTWKGLLVSDGSGQLAHHFPF